MGFILQPWQLLFVCLAGWVNREQQQVIGYLRTENQVLKEKLGKKRILLDDDQRRRLAVKGRVLGRKVLEQIGLDQKRTSPHDHLVDFRNVPYFEAKRIKIVGGLSQWGVFTKQPR